MSMSRVYLCLIFLTFLTSPLVLCSRSSPKLAEASSAAKEKNLKKSHIHPPAMLVSQSTNAVDSPSSMTKIDDEPATNSAIAAFFRYRFPFQGWPFHKYAPFPNPANPSVPTTPATGAEEEESEKVPSSPTKGDNRDGGNA